MTNNQLTDPQAPVSDEELDQMIWKLERDGGMTPKLLSLMRELREVRKAKGKPVAFIEVRMLEELSDGSRSCGRIWPYERDELSGESRIPLYLAPPAPAEPQPVPDSVISAAVNGIMATYADNAKDCRAMVRTHVEQACRAAIQESGHG